MLVEHKYTSSRHFEEKFLEKYQLTNLADLSEKEDRYWLATRMSIGRSLFYS